MIAPSSGPRPQLWILRHGETEWSKSGQYTGLTDLPLTVEGEQQAVEARKVLDAVDFDLVLTSRLRRARRTARAARSADAIDSTSAATRCMRRGATSIDSIAPVRSKPRVAGTSLP